MSSVRPGVKLRDGGLVAIAIALMNVTTYALTLGAARILGPAQFGQFSALLGVIIVVNVLSLGLQATGARRLAHGTTPREQLERAILRTTGWAALGVLVLCCAVAPLVSHILRLDTPWSAVLMGVTASLLCLMGGQAGILQGELRWVPLSLMYLSMGCARLIFGVAALLWGHSTVATMAGVAVAALVPALIGRAALRHPSRSRIDVRPTTSAPRERPGNAPESLWREVLHTSHVLFAFFAVSNIDIVLARAFLDDHESGSYAAGIVLTKAVLFLPQFVVIVLFPRLASGHQGRRTDLLGLGAIATLGALATGTAALLPGAALAFVGGAAYAPIAASLWVFALLGAVLAAVQLLVYAVIARRQEGAVWLLWVAFFAMTVIGSIAHSATQLLTVKVCVDVTLFLALGAFAWLTAGPTPVGPRLPETRADLRSPADADERVTGRPGS